MLNFCKVEKNCTDNILMQINVVHIKNTNGWIDGWIFDVDIPNEGDNVTVTYYNWSQFIADGINKSTPNNVRCMMHL